VEDDGNALADGRAAAGPGSLDTSPYDAAMSDSPPLPDDTADPTVGGPSSPTEPEAAAVTWASIFRGLGPAGPLAVLWLVVPGTAGLALVLFIDPVSVWLREHGSLAIALYVAVFAVSSGLGLLPTYAQALVGGWAFGLLAGVPAALGGFLGGSLIGYAVAKRASGDRVHTLIEAHPRASAVRRALVGRGFWPTLGIVSVIRIPPNSPFAVTNLTLASCGTALAPYGFGTLLGMTPRTALLVGLAAAGAAEAGDEGLSTYMSEPKKTWQLVLAIGTALAAMSVLYLIGNRAINQVIDREGALAGPAPDPAGPSEPA